MTRKLFKVLKAVSRFVRRSWATGSVRILFGLNGIRGGRRLRAIGIPSVNVSLGGRAEIGERLTIRTGLHDTEVGMVGSRIRVGPKGMLKIGDRVGMSNVTIVCEQSVEIGDDVLLGGGVQIFDTDFHPLDAGLRCSGTAKRNDARTLPVRIGSRVFVGTNAIVGKGVAIGDEAVIAAGSVVVKDVPPREVWGGNPARRIR